MNPIATFAWRGFGALVVVFMLTPMVLVVIFSVAENALTNFPMGGFSTKWYSVLWSNPEFWRSFSNSLQVAGVVAFVSTLVGTLAAMTLSRMRPRFSGPCLILLCLPIMMPPLVIGIALLVYFVRWVHVDLSLATVMMGHIVITQPFVILIIYARMVNFDYAVLDSARDLGASPWTTFRTVTLPLIQATIIGAALIAIAISPRRVRDHFLHHRRRQHAADLRVRQDSDQARSLDQRNRHDPDPAHGHFDHVGAAPEPLPGLVR